MTGDRPFSVDIVMVYKLIKKVLVVSGVVLFVYGATFLYYHLAPTDLNGDRPIDVVQRFLEHAERGEIDKARALWIPAERRRLFDQPPLNFEEFCEMHRRYDTVEILGAVREKGGYWRVAYNGYEDGVLVRDTSFSVKLVDGMWRLDRELFW